MSDELERQLVELAPGKKQLLRVGSLQQWRDREEARIANTASALRERVRTELARTNGHG